jgi:hypothetical protein
MINDPFLSKFFVENDLFPTEVAQNDLDSDDIRNITLKN